MLYPDIQIFDFVPRIQVWDVNEDSIELFWNPLPRNQIKEYKIYYSLNYSSGFAAIQTVPNQSGFSQKGPYTNNVVWTSIPKTAVGFVDILYYFKITSVDLQNNESALADVPVKPVFTIYEHRQKGRYYGRTGNVYLSFDVTVPAGTTYADNKFDVLYTLGKIGNGLNISVEDAQVNLKMNNISAFPIRIEAGEDLLLDKEDIDITKLFFENDTVDDAQVRILISG